MHACFNARIQLDGLNVYKTDASYKVSIFGLLLMLEKASEKSVLLFVKRHGTGVKHERLVGYIINGVF